MWFLPELSIFVAFAVRLSVGLALLISIPKLGFAQSDGSYPLLQSTRPTQAPIQNHLSANFFENHPDFQIQSNVSERVVPESWPEREFSFQALPPAPTVNGESQVNPAFGPPSSTPSVSDDQANSGATIAPSQFHVDQALSLESPANSPANSPMLSEVQKIFAQPANRTGERRDLLDPYASRGQFLDEADRLGDRSMQLPVGFHPWWTPQTANMMGIKNSPLQVSLDTLLTRALSNSPHIQVAATTPHIQQAQLMAESAQFDWNAFLESTYDDQNNPIGNELTTGNNDDRFVQQEWNGRGGVRRRATNGSEIEIAQQLGTLQNNSRFLVPPNQGNARLELNYRHPLLRGQGIVNESVVMLAEIDFRSASDELLGRIQSHLTDVTETYWELVRARSELLQRQRLLTEAERVLRQLQGRAEVDALDRQIYRARAAVAKRKAEIARSVTSVKNAESRIRLLVNDPEIIQAAKSELIPVDLPSLEYLPIQLDDAVSTALVNRPDISQAIRDVKATSVRLGVARNEVLPRLDLVVGSYVAGLDGDFDATNSWINQFRDGRPGFNVGFEFEVPIGNRAAIARQERQQWEANRVLHQFRAVVETGLNEVEIAVREVQTAHQELQGRYYAMVAAQNETKYLADRWQTLPEIDDSVTLLLEDLLDSQERLADEEAAFAKAQFDYSVSTVKLKQAMGTLFQVN